MKYAGIKKGGKVRIMLVRNKAIFVEGSVKDVKEEMEGVVVYSSGQRLVVESEGQLFYFTRHGLWSAQTKEQAESYKNVELFK